MDNTQSPAYNNGLRNVAVHAKKIAAMNARRGFYHQVIKDEVNLQELRHLIGTKKKISNRERRIERLKMRIADKESVGRIIEGTDRESFSPRGEKIVGGRLWRLKLYQMDAIWNPFSWFSFHHLRNLAFKSKCMVTERHFRGVARFAEAIYDNLPASGKGAVGSTRQEVKTAALMHDEGKIEIPSSLLRQTSKPTSEDITIIKRHPEESMRFLEEMGLPNPIVSAARQHHMQYDDRQGSRSYPPKDPGESLTQLSQLISVADAAEAMTAGRYNQPLMSIEDAVTELNRGKGMQFSPVYVEAIVEAFEKDASFLKWWDRRRDGQDKRSAKENRVRKPRPKEDRTILAERKPQYGENGLTRNINDLD
ncbi:HD domain protein [Candidatus Burarchaeum australiense]|nr:HD domain protein [Candidatus Burarchaeum australiense]